jgi:AhpD family alkylhydroperoxidase
LSQTFENYRRRRKAGNEAVLATDNKTIKRFFNLDSASYRDGALPGNTKELLGLVASMVLRCNDCIDYHLEQCVDAGFNLQELEEAMSVAMVVGGSIVIPHMRHARESLNFLYAERAESSAP